MNFIIKLFCVICITSNTADFSKALPTDNHATSLSSHFIKENITSINDLEETCKSFDACSHMHYHSKSYKASGNAENNFNTLINLAPTEIWDDKSHFEFVFDPTQNKYLSASEELPELAIGQVYFLDLNILNLAKIPVAFKIIGLDSINHIITFSYIKKNKSNGVQRITFKDKNGHTQILHETRFQSDSKVRDVLLYKSFHTILLNNFYKHLKAKL